MRRLVQESTPGRARRGRRNARRGYGARGYSGGLAAPPVRRGAGPGDAEPRCLGWVVQQVNL